MYLPLFIILSVLSALAFMGYLTRSILKRDVGTDRMKAIADAIYVGSKAFLRRQYFTAAVFIAILAGAFALFLTPLDVVSFVLGAATTAIAGYIGMSIAVKANVRTANAARSSLSDSLKIAFYGGAVMGLAVISICLLGVALLFFVDPTPVRLVGFAVGSSVMALFSRVGGGIFTKAADVGADLVGKVELGIPEDDPRNPATIADAVGDNVGDVAGMGADLFQSYVCALIAAMIVGSMPDTFKIYGTDGVILPLIMCAVGIFATIIGILFVRTEKNPFQAINRDFSLQASLQLWLSIF